MLLFDDIILRGENTNIARVHSSAPCLLCWAYSNTYTDTCTLQGRWPLSLYKRWATGIRVVARRETLTITTTTGVQYWSRRSDESSPFRSTVVSYDPPQWTGHEARWFFLLPNPWFGCQWYGDWLFPQPVRVTAGSFNTSTTRIKSTPNSGLQCGAVPDCEREATTGELTLPSSAPLWGLQFDSHTSGPHVLTWVGIAVGLLGLGLLLRPSSEGFATDRLVWS